VDALNKWFDDMAQSSAGSLVLFVLVFLSRVTIDEALRRREKKKRHRHKEKKPHAG